MPRETDVIAFGDSLVACWPEAELAPAFPGCRILNLGLPGDRIQNALWRLDALPTGHLRPTWLCLLLGTNNLGDGDPADVIAAGLEAVTGRMLALWGRPRLLIVTLPWRVPLRPLGEGHRLHVNEVLLPDLARRLGATLVDADRALGRGPDETAISLEADGLHVSAAGYVRLGRALAEAVGGTAM